MATVQQDEPRDQTQDDCTIVDLLRHGECEGGHIFRGSGTDVPLSERGFKQMQKALQKPAATGSAWNKVLSSPLTRCRQFSENLADALDISLEIYDDLREIHFGLWEGQAISDIWQQDPDLMTKYFKDPQSYTPEGGEPIEQVRRRLKLCWSEIVTSHRGQHILLVQHGGTIRILLTLLLQLPVSAMSRFEVPYASLTRIKVFHQGEEHFPTLVFHNA